MADDPTQQQQPGLLSQIGSGLGQVLPYAIPAALGAVMGRGVGGGPLAGALAGAGMAAGDIQEQQKQQQEMAIRQKELQIEAQNADLEAQKATIALRNDKSAQAYAKTITDPDQRAMYLDPDSRPSYFKNLQWKNFSNIISKDPQYVAQHPTEAKLLPMVGPDMGPKLFESSLSGKFPNGHVTVTNADGTTTVYGLGANGEKTPIVSGVSPKTIAPAKAAGGGDPDKAEQALRTKAVSSLTSQYTKWRTENDKVQAKNDAKWVGSPDPLPHPEIAAYSDADSYAAANLDRQMSLLKGKPDPNATLAAASLPKGKPPKELWGKSGVINGKRVNIDANGNVTPAK